MEIPCISGGAVGSRFVSQTDIESAKARRDEQWKAAYARLGQEPPPQPAEDSYDGRSLAEKLAANKIAKQEEWEEKTKLANQFRALEEDEVMFLDSLREKQLKEERQRKEMDGEEVKGFREAVAARTSAANNLPPALVSKPVVDAPNLARTAPAATKKDPKKSLKGVLVKKKTKPPASSSLDLKAKEEESNQPDAKRRKVSTA